MKDYRHGALPGETFQEQGRDITEGLEVAKRLVDGGYDALNVDVGTYDSWYWNHPPMYFQDGMYLEYAKLLKGAVDVPVITAGRMDDPDLAERALADDATDMVGLGRPLLADPELPNKVRAGELADIRRCLSCHDGCMGRIASGKRLSCAVNPSCGREMDYALTPTLEPKSILVVGGGLSGMEFARVAAIARTPRDPVRTEHPSSAGTSYPAACRASRRTTAPWSNGNRRQLEKVGVDVRLETTVDHNLVERLGPDEVIVATGSTPRRIDLPGAESGRVYLAEELLLDPSKVEGDVLVVGGGLVGCESALWLAEQGYTVKVAEMLPEILGGPHGELPFMNYDMLTDLLDYHDVEILTGTAVERIDGNTATLATPVGEAHRRRGHRHDLRGVPGERRPVS